MGIHKVQTDSKCAGRRFSNLDSLLRQVVGRVVTGERLKEPQATCTGVLSLNDLYPSLNAATPWNLRTPTWAAGHTPMSPGTEGGVSGQLGGGQPQHGPAPKLTQIVRPQLTTGCSSGLGFCWGKACEEPRSENVFTNLKGGEGGEDGGLAGFHRSCSEEIQQSEVKLK